MSRFSVKRPYTVLVAVVMVIILGYVSFTSMTTDLLPDMELPYAIVITTYPGASPEEVENEVTIPIEEAMATINNIENVSSVSNENYSLAILEFAADTSMDTASLDMRESLDQLKSTFTNEAIGNPIIMKINPDMLPIMIAGVANENIQDANELTEFVDDKIIPSLQSVDGVASVSASGELEERVEVVLSQDKIDDLNDRIRAALDDKFADAEKEIQDGQAELDDAKAQLEKAQDQLNEGKDQAAGQIGQGQAQLGSQEIQMYTAQAQLQQQLSTAQTSLTALQTIRTQLESQKAELEENLKALDGLADQLEEVNAGISQLEYAIDQLQTAGQTLETLRQTAADLERQLEEAQAAGNEELIMQLTAALEQTKAGIAQIEAGLSQAGITDYSAEGIAAGIAQLQAQLVQLQAAQATLQAAADTYEENKAAIDQGLAQVDAGLKELENNEAALKEAIRQLTAAIEQIESGKSTMTDAMGQLNTASISSAIEMALAGAQISDGLNQIIAGQAQMDAAVEQLNSSKEAAYDQADANNILSLTTFQQLMTAQNFSMPAGYVEESGIQYLIRVGDKIKDVAALEDTVLLDLHMDGIDPIKVTDVADVYTRDNSDSVYANLNGNPGIIFTMEKQTGYSTGDVTDSLKERFEKLEGEYEGLHFVTLMDQGVYIDMIVKSVLSNLGWGALLAILILLIFLRDLRPTFIIACAIPISITTCIVLMYFSGISLNVISLSGLALGVGMLVDNSIVVIENIYRMRNEGMPLKKAAIVGAKQVSGAIIASTLTTVCVFAPIVFTDGLTRQLFVDMGLTIAYSLLSSLAVAMTVVPAMSSRMLKGTGGQKAGRLDRLLGVYEKSIRWGLRFKPVVLLAAIAMLVISFMGAASNGTALIPEMASTQATVTIEVAKDKDFAYLTEMADQVTTRILEVEGIDEVGTTAGSSGGSISLASLSSAGNTHTATMYLILSEDIAVDDEKLVQDITDRTSDLDCTVTVDTTSSSMTAMMASGVTIRVTGRDLDDLRDSARTIASKLEEVEGLIDINDGIGETTPELRITVDREKAISYGLTTAQVYAEIAAKLAEARSSMTLTSATDSYAVYVLDGENEDYTRTKIRTMTVTGTDSEQKKVDVPLAKIASFSDDESMNSISRNAQTRYLSVTAHVDSDHNVGLLSDGIKQKLAELELPAGIEYEMAGEDAEIQDAFKQIYKMLALALAFMYLIMVAQFQSLLSPFIIMFTIPLAFTGGFLGLWLSGSEISMIAMIGFVMLSGVIVNNGIVLVDYINQLRIGGMEKRDAIVKASSTRLRPILMTALTTILAMSTLMFSKDIGASMSKPMAIVVSVGLLYGTLLTLFVVPCVYDLLNRKKVMQDPLAEDEALDAIDINDAIKEVDFTDIAGPDPVDHDYDNFAADYDNGDTDLYDSDDDPDDNPDDNLIADADGADDVVTADADDADADGAADTDSQANGAHDGSADPADADDTADPADSGVR